MQKDKRSTYLERVCGLFLIMLIASLGTLQVVHDANAGPALMQSVVLKHRITLLPVTPKKGQDKNQPIIIKFTNAEIKFPDEKTQISPVQLLTAVDLTKKEIARSEFIRLVDLGLLRDETQPGKKAFQSVASETDMVLLARYSRQKNKTKVFFRLMDSGTGQLLMTSGAVASGFDAAVRNALEKMDDYLLTRVWRCQVEAVSGDSIIINRGELDGFVEGIELSGYTMETAPNSTGGEPVELRLMKYGIKGGFYRVSYVGEMYSKLTASSGAKSLKKGDILELPAIKKREERVSRGSRVWDSIYDKK